MTWSADSTAQQTQPQEPQLSLLRFCGSNYLNKINGLKEAQKRNFSLPKGKVPPAAAGEAPIPEPIWWDDG